MDEYISKEKAIKELREVYENEYPTASGDFDEYASHDVPNVLRNIPSADVQPVKRGRWIDHEQFERKNCNVCIECSVCNKWFGHDCIPKTKFCPNCGARMDGEQND